MYGINMKLFRCCTFAYFFIFLNKTVLVLLILYVGL